MADLGCILRVDVHCEACRMEMIGILSAINGVYSVTIDAEEKTVKISGEVDPSMLVWALAKSGKHAEIVWMNLKHPSMITPNTTSRGWLQPRTTSRYPSNNYGYGYNYALPQTPNHGYGSYTSNHGYGSYTPNQGYGGSYAHPHHYPHRRPVETHRQVTNYTYGPPPAAHNPFYGGVHYY